MGIAAVLAQKPITSWGNMKYFYIFSRDTHVLLVEQRRKRNILWHQSMAYDVFSLGLVLLSSICLIGP
jgi:hypothetical protein